MMDVRFVYVMLHFPLLFICKIGISKNVQSRKRTLNETVPGWFVPVFFMPMPHARKFEQRMHRIFAPIRIDFYRGDGHTETFFFVAGLVTILAMLVFWAVIILIFGITIQLFLL